MIFEAAKLPKNARLSADLCVIGSGPGGATVAAEAAQAGLRVVLLEAGPLLTPSDMTQREEEMFPQLFALSGTQTTRDRAVHIHQGKGLGGSSLHNLNLCKRIPEQLISQWGLERLGSAQWGALYDEVEGLLSVSKVPPVRWNRHNRILQAGCEALGWRGGGLAHNRSGCLGSGFCELGCAYDAKNNALKVMIPKAVAAGGEVVVHCAATRIRHDGKRVLGVDAVAVEGPEEVGRVVVDAPAVCVSASATGTAALLLRSGVPDPSARTGRGLRIHPAVVVAGEFDEPVRAWQGIPQTYECTELLSFDGHDRRIWIVPAFAHPMSFATLVPGHGDVHRRLMERYAHVAVLTAMLHDETAGTVEPSGSRGSTIDYWPNAADRAQLIRGLHGGARLLMAAGARRVTIPAQPYATFERGADLSSIEDLELTRGWTDVTAVHPMASVPMGDDPATAPVDSAGRHHHLGGLWVADGSLFPTSIGVPPQLSIYALGLHVGRAIVEAGGR